MDAAACLAACTLSELATSQRRQAGMPGNGGQSPRLDRMSFLRFIAALVLIICVEMLVKVVEFFFLVLTVFALLALCIELFIKFFRFAANRRPVAAS